MITYRPPKKNGFSHQAGLKDNSALIAATKQFIVDCAWHARPGTISITLQERDLHKEIASANIRIISGRFGEGKRFVPPGIDVRFTLAHIDWEIDPTREKEVIDFIASMHFPAEDKCLIGVWVAYYLDAKQGPPDSSGSWISLRLGHKRRVQPHFLFADLERAESVLKMVERHKLFKVNRSFLRS